MTITITFKPKVEPISLYNIWQIRENRTTNFIEFTSWFNPNTPACYHKDAIERVEIYESR